ncbi:DUF5753 domain-containing protein [Nocardia sp. NRRL S-836]|uniref:DUF5753 domain-containing protein n=1 Tax=Nocardia sp. NRRL S-836 TaxID=1519492 RepID=UPI0012F81420|nr:DUF5753 domain-containing protein [Nocardia sp. NRRL S-836]
MLDWDPAKLSNAVNGKGGVSQLEAAALLGICRADSAELAHLLALHQDSHIRGWWQQHGVCTPVQLRTVVEHVRLTKTLISWHTHMVPLFLQTADYMRAVLIASATVPSDEVEDRVQAQLGIQEALQRSGAQCTFFIHELALRLKIGGPAVHDKQLLHLLFMMNWQNIRVRIVPAALGAHAGLAGPFTRMTFAKYEPLVWVAAENSSLFVESADAVAGYGRLVRALEETSWDEEESRAFLVRECDDL